MSWLGSTLKTLDTRKELVNYIGSNTITSRAVVTNAGGEIDSSVVTLAELALLSGVSSNVQTQLTDLGNDKEDEITGAATTITQNNLTSNRVLLSDVNGKISASDMTAATFAYLDPTSSVQTQLNGKHPEITASAPLSQSRVDGLASTLSGKQPLIGSSTNLVLNKVTFGAGETAIDFTGDLSGYATTGALSSGLATKQASGSYATTSALASGLATKQASGSYATTTELTNGLATKQASGSYATSTQLTNGLATKQASGSYATTSDLSSGLATKQASGSYATTSDLSSGLATKQASGSYATTSALASGLATKQATISNAAPIAVSNVSGLSTALAASAGQGDPMTCVTEQVTGTSPIYSFGTSNIDNGALTYIAFAGQFTRFGMTHVQNTALFNINVASEYTVNVQLRVTAGLVNERGMYWVILRRYKQRPPSNIARGTPFRDYYLGSSYYRDDTTAYNDIVLGGNVRVHFEGNDENFEIVVQRAYQQNVNSGNNTLDNSQSWITIERHAYNIA